MATGLAMAPKMISAIAKVTTVLWTKPPGKAHVAGAQAGQRLALFRLVSDLSSPENVCLFALQYLPPHTVAVSCSSCRSSMEVSCPVASQA